MTARRAHLAALGLAVVLTVPALVWWSTTIVFVNVASYYTVIAAHAAAWSEARSSDAPRWTMVHGLLTVIFVAGAGPFVVWWLDSVRMLVFLSMWALVVEHWTGALAET